MNGEAKGAMHLFVFGLGNSGLAFARAMKDEVAWTGGTVRTVDKAIAVTGDGVRAFIFDGTSAGIGVGAAIHHATHLVTSIAPGDGDPVLSHHRQAIVAAPHLRWIGYLSTVGVYGDHGGDWVDEASEPKPQPGRLSARLAAETAWLAVAAERQVPVAILRIAGIYGPGRNSLKKLNDGRAHRIVKPGQVFNRIHVDDIVQVLAAAATSATGGVFNVAHDQPAPPQDVVAFAAELMGVTPPPEIPFEEAELTPLARSFYGQNKRVANDRIKRELGVILRYPTYREGLRALWREDTWRSQGSP